MAFFKNHWRAILSAIAGVIAAWIAIPVVGEFFIEIARERGLYKHPSERLAGAMERVSAIADLPGFRGIAIFLIGVVVGIWLDTLVRRKERTRDRNAPRVKQWLDPLAAIECFVDGEIRNKRDNARERQQRLGVEYDALHRHLKSLIEPEPFGQHSLSQEQSSPEIDAARVRLAEARSALTESGEPIVKFEREILEDLIAQLKRGRLVGKGFRVSGFKVADATTIIPAEYWHLLNFNTYEPNRQTVEGGGKTYKGLQIGRNENWF